MGLIKTSDRIPLPDDADAWVVVRQLTKRQLDRAFEVSRVAAQGWRKELMDSIRASGRDPDEVIEESRQAAMAKGADAAGMDVDPLQIYDACEVVDAGLTETSYGKSVGAIKPSDYLHPDTVMFAARQILGFSKRPPLKSPDTDGS